MNETSDCVHKYLPHRSSALKIISMIEGAVYCLLCIMADYELMSPAIEAVMEIFEMISADKLQIDLVFKKI